MTSDALQSSARRAFPLAVALSLTPILAGCAAPKDMPAAGDDGASSSDDGALTGGDMAADDGDTGGEDADPADNTGSSTDASADDGTTDGAPTDDEADDEADDGSTDAEETGPGQPACADEGGICTLDFPEEWEGPVAMITWADGEETPECAGGYDIPIAMSLSNDLVAPPAACTCECGDAEDGACEGELSIFSTTLIDGACFPIGATELGTIEPASTLELDESGVVGLALNENEPVEYVGGSCDEAESENVQTPAWASHVALCAGTPIDGECEEDTACMPEPVAPQSDAVCIWQPGDLSCPSGWGFDDRTVVYQGIDDTRACSECSCGEPSGACTDGIVQYSGTSTQPGIPFNVAPGLAPDGCSPVFFTTMTATLAAWTGVQPTDDVGCNPTGGAPVGQAVGTDPITVCCYTPE